jgi:hypothetical protein
MMCSLDEGRSRAAHNASWWFCQLSSCIQHGATHKLNVKGFSHLFKHARKTLYPQRCSAKEKGALPGIWRRS